MAAQPPQTIPCRFCAATPAAEVAFRSLWGIVFWYRLRTVRAPMCRDCGTAIFRRESGICLRLGWWAVWSIIAGPVVLTRNYRAYRRIQRLGPAQRPPGNAPVPYEQPLLHQPAVLLATAGYVVVIGGLVTLGVLQATTPFTPDQKALIGTCIAQQSDGSYVESTCDQPNTFRVESLAHDTSSCSTGTSPVRLEGTSITQDVVLCVAATS